MQVTNSKSFNRKFCPTWAPVMTAKKLGEQKCFYWVLQYFLQVEKVNCPPHFVTRYIHLIKVSDMKTIHLTRLLIQKLNRKFCTLGASYNTNKIRSYLTTITFKLVMLEEIFSIYIIFKFWVNTWRWPVSLNCLWVLTLSKYIYFFHILLFSTKCFL